MNIIECGGYDENDKKEILKNYVWPEMVERLKFKTDDLVFEDDAMKFVISEYSQTEKGVRNLIRAMETVITRINMLRVSNHESMKEYPFYMDVKFPLKITPKVIQTMLKDTSKNKQEDIWKMMYT
jgi:ATP-dependent Lon protease